MQNNYLVLKPKNTLNEHRWHFASFNCTLLPITICNCSSDLTLTTDVLYAPNIKNTWDWLFDCLHRLSKLVEIHMINGISKTIYSALSPPDLLDPTGATYDDACAVWGHSPVDFDSHKLSSWKVVHQCEHVNTHWWTTFQLLSLWLSMSTSRLWPQTTLASS